MIAVAVLALLGGMAFAADNDSHTVTLQISPISAITMNPGTTVILDIDDAAGTLVGGATPGPDTDNSQYLQYTVIRDAALTVFKITVGCTGTPPSGTQLTVIATGLDPSHGLNSVARTLTNASTADLVTAIPSCVTGTGGTDGKQLTYTYSVTNFALLADNDLGVDLTILYTVVQS